ncbi:hypothetical protein JOY44_04855 [Phormidium sp. CLA17]|uniref:hypothetical protein n=1 Tax=Leptolyngbya sp. Cla-17 TaxID=2803751 RepID=UPI001491BF41|nr:hypothetical protein [Leptolyngbya sp. Cla-17]MBM0740953.1 hypothetical protein [Leptolyngbya sp. Cla-17]
MKIKFDRTNHLINIARFASISALAVCSTVTLFQPEAAHSQQSPSNPSTVGDLNEQNGNTPNNSENPSTIRRNPSTDKNDSLTAPSNTLPGRGSYTAPRSGSSTNSLSPKTPQDAKNPSMTTSGDADSQVGGSRRTSPTIGGSGDGANGNMRMNGTTQTQPTRTSQDSMSPSMRTDGTADAPVGGSRRTSPTIGGSGDGANGNMRMNGTTQTQPTRTSQDSMSPSMRTDGTADAPVGGSRRTSPTIGGSGDGANGNMRMNGNTNSNTDTRVNSTTEMNGTMNNSTGTSGTSNAVPGLW